MHRLLSGGFGPPELAVSAQLGRKVIYVCIVCRPEVLAPRANRFRLAQPKGMRARKNNLYCILK